MTEVLLGESAIQARVAELADDIRRDYSGRAFTVVGVLTGSLIFLADLVRAIELPLRIGLVGASSYRGTTTTAGALVIQDALLPDVRGRHLLLLDDILDTGQTISGLVRHLSVDRGAATVKTCVLLRKVGRQTVPFEPDYVGFAIPDRFVVGYGLDFDDDYRHLRFIGVLPDGHGE